MVRALTMDLMADRAYLGFKIATKTSSLLSYCAKISAAITQVPKGLSEATMALKSLKIVKGVLAIRDLCVSVVKFSKASLLKDRFFAGVKALNSVSKIVGAVEVIFTYLKELKVVDSAALAWTTITGYVFLPLSVIGTAISTYKAGETIKYLHDFRSRVKKIDDPQLLANRLLDELKNFKKVKVITEESPLKKRMEDILDRLKSGNAILEEEAKKELTMLKKRLKDRVRERVGIATLKSALSIAGLACTIIGLACPPAALGLAIAGLALGIISFANFAYTRSIPTGDILPTEKRMFYAKVIKLFS